MKTPARVLAVLVALSGSFPAPSSGTSSPEISPKRHQPVSGSIRPFHRDTVRGDGTLARAQRKDSSYAPSPGRPQLFSDYFTPPLAESIPPDTSDKSDLSAAALWFDSGAKQEFKGGNLREAEELYDKAIAIAPNNVYLLHSKALMQLHAGKCNAAMRTLGQAIAVAPGNDSILCTLGIVEYRQDNLDEALIHLKEALAINSRNAIAHNYFGIIASQTGWPELAKKEIEHAIRVDPFYGAPHFNLALILATETPPDKETAREHYQRALDLGVEPDDDLERLIK